MIISPTARHLQRHLVALLFSYISAFKVFKRQAQSFDDCFVMVTKASTSWHYNV